MQGDVLAGKVTSDCQLVCCILLVLITHFDTMRCSRLAMVGFAAILVTEALSGKNIPEFWCECRSSNALSRMTLS